MAWKLNSPFDPEEQRLRALGPSGRRALSLALQNGWLETTGDSAASRLQSDEWALYCRDNQLDIFWGGETGLTVRPLRPLSPLGWDEWRLVAGELGLECEGENREGVYRVSGFEEGKLPAVFRRMKLLLENDRSPARAVELKKLGRLQEGMAAVLDSTGLWPDLGPNDSVFVQEIRGRPGRCVVLRHLYPPIVDVPLAQFQILCPEEA